VRSGVARIGRAVVDPLARGSVQGLSRPDGNAIGFTPFEYSTAFKLLEFFKDIAPRIARVALLQHQSM
jgi:putative tryptophan/tyrosine transport system substrate-binding protein